MRGLLRAGVRQVYRGLLPAGAKNTLRLYLLWDQDDKPPQLIEGFAASSVLVLAPHMDDEVFGCGGTLCRHVQAGARVRVLFLTDGRRGGLAEDEHSQNGAGRREAERRLTETRRSESRAACAHLGVHELHFLDEEDGALEAIPRVVEQVAAQLATVRPDVVYVPALLDVHRDHWAACRIFAAALERVPEWLSGPGVVRQYEAWTPMLVNRLADITEVFETKRAAMCEFGSQIRQVDYVHTATGLNAYRAVHCQQGRGYAEGFFESSPRAYVEILERWMQSR